MIGHSLELQNDTAVAQTCHLHYSYIFLKYWFRKHPIYKGCSIVFNLEHEFKNEINIKDSLHIDDKNRLFLSSNYLKIKLNINSIVVATTLNSAKLLC